MDEIMIKLKTGIMKTLAEKLLEKVLKNSLGDGTSLAINEMEINTYSNTETYELRLDGSIYVPKKVLLDLIVKGMK